MIRCGQFQPNSAGAYNQSVPMMQTGNQNFVPGQQYSYSQNTIPMPFFPTGQATGQPLGPGPMSQVIPGTNPQPSGIMPQVPSTGTTFTGSNQPPQTLASVLYIPGYLQSKIGSRVRVEFLIGTTTMTDRVGTLIGVGVSYILLRLEATDDILLCDIYSIKFVTFYH